MPPTVPTLPRGEIIDGIDHPIGAAAESPPSEMLIQISARIAVCAWAAPSMPSPNAVPHIKSQKCVVIISKVIVIGAILVMRLIFYGFFYGFFRLIVVQHLMI